MQILNKSKRVITDGTRIETAALLRNIFCECLFLIRRKTLRHLHLDFSFTDICIFIGKKLFPVRLPFVLVRIFEAILRNDLWHSWTSCTIDLPSFIFYVETWEMVCNTRTDSVADLLSSTEGRKRSVFFSFQRVLTIVSVQKRCLFSPHYQREALNGRERTGYTGLWQGKKK